ncbi:MAG: lactate utilization protein LutB domain-containing protein [Geminicoccaceae bacterium]
MGSVLTPQFIGIDKGHTLPNASTFCGKCQEVCPVRIPLPKLMRHWREEQHERKLVPPRARFALAAWAFMAKRPRLYRLATGVAMRALGILGARDGYFSSMPFAGGWTGSRELPAPQGATFMSRYKKTRGRSA